MASPGQYQYGPDWHHAMLGWPTLGPVNPSHEMAGGEGGGDRQCQATITRSLYSLLVFQS